ncbi:hypothetical protein KR084_000666, partial [Drosophila pseudotakahashii]
QTPMTYEAIFVSIDWASNSQPFDWTKLRLIGRDHILNGTLKIMEDFNDDHYTFAVDIYTNSARDGNFKLMPISFPRQGICTLFKNHGYYIRDSIKYGINTDLLINRNACVFPKGTYLLKNVTINAKRWPTIMPRGLCRHVCKFYKDGVHVGTYNVTSSIEDRTP